MVLEPLNSDFQNHILDEDQTRDIFVIGVLSLQLQFSCFAYWTGDVRCPNPVIYQCYLQLSMIRIRPETSKTADVQVQT